MTSFLKPEQCGNMLITTDDWFYGPDGNSYKGLFGPVQIVPAKDMLGLRPRDNETWFALVGQPGKQFVIAGCRIHYAQVTGAVRPPKTAQAILDLSEGGGS